MSRRRPPLPPGPYLVVGLARSGAAVAELLVTRGARVYGADSGNPVAAGRLAALGVEVSLDGDGIDLLERVSTVVKSPGVPADAPVLGAARAAGKDVLGELEVGWRTLANRFVGITGTNGKTTVAEWLGHVCRKAGEPVEVAGNVGTPVSELALAGERRLDPEATIVCECSSFQLEDSIAFAPEVAVLLNLSPDHLDRHGDFDSYREAKLRIFSSQAEHDVAIVDADRFPSGKSAIPGAGQRRRYGIDACADGGCAVWVEGGRIRDGRGDLLPVSEVGLAAEHNLRNAMAVAVAALEAGIDRAAVASGLRSFRGVAHRMERVATIAGVSYVNDSKATNPAAAAAALGSFGGGVLAIMGGSLKGGGFEGLREPVAESCRAVHLIGEAAPRLRDELRDSGVELIDCPDLASAVRAASKRARPGDTVLLSPACASFDAFRDYEDRGRRFRGLVAALGEGVG